MDMRTAKKTVFAHFNTTWAGATPVIFGNESQAEPAAPWVRVTMREISSVQLTMGATGNKLFERHDVVSVQVFSPADAGEGPRDDLLQAARDVFEGRSLSVAGETIDFYRVDADPADDEPHLLTGVVKAICRFQQRK